MNNIDGNEYALRKYMNQQEADERELEFFDDDTELLFNEIDNNINRIKAIASDYDIDLEDYIQDKIKEMM